MQIKMNSKVYMVKKSFPFHTAEANPNFESRLPSSQNFCLEVAYFILSES